MKELKIGNLHAEVPIVQGGMGVGISLSGLASAVANAGVMLALYNAFKGHMENGYAFCGTNAWRSDKIISVKELIETLKAEFEAKVAMLKRA